MEKIKVFCPAGHLMCSVMDGADACYVEGAQDGVLCFPGSWEVHLPKCLECADLESVERGVQLGRGPNKTAASKT